MASVTVTLPPSLHDRLRREAARRRTSKAAVLREAFARTADRGTLYERAQGLLGAVNGPGDLSTRSKMLPGYGKSGRR